MVHRFDYLVLGSGIAGLSCALKFAPHGRVAVLTKKNRAESNTNYAQGGIACVTSSEDTFGLHIRDTLDAGAGLCKERVVREIVEDGPDRIKELLDLGIEFSERDIPSKPGERELDLGREGGHSKRRILHAEDMTGREIERALLAAVESHPRIQMFENYFAVDLITTRKVGLTGSNRCIGVYALDSKNGGVHTFLATATVLATGGCGKVYLYTTNPDIATGDGVAMAFRAGARVSNMEFIQFHPTCLYHPEVKSFLISEAVRGEGAKLVDAQGQEFMHRYDPRKELAPRDIVARAIDAEMKRTGADCVYLDLTHKPEGFAESRFPNIYRTCLKYGIDMAEDPVPVVPAAHYQCGGVVTDTQGRTEIEALFAIGEVACTGLHGANRLASNSLLEAVVLAHRAATVATALPRLPEDFPAPTWVAGNVDEPDEMVVVSHNWDEVRRLMWDYVGIVRSSKRLQRALARLRNLQREIQDFYWNFKVNTDLLELRNLVLVAQIIVISAYRRRESIGLHYTLNYPDGVRLSDPPQDTVVDREDPAFV